MNELWELSRENRVRIIGPIRQELLTGVREQAQFLRLRDRLRTYQDAPLGCEEFESAAEIANRCRARGIAGSPVDFLICAVAIRRDWTIFTLDRDFHAYASVIPVVLHTPRRPSVVQ